MTGSTRRISSSTGTGAAPGRVDSPPTSMIVGPFREHGEAVIDRAAVSRKLPPSENESGVTLRMPMTTPRVERSRERPPPRCQIIAGPWRVPV